MVTSWQTVIALVKVAGPLAIVATLPSMIDAFRSDNLPSVLRNPARRDIRRIAVSLNHP